jgi:Ser/Thr protein kinase RdoA (MazF antagonist)
MDNLITVYQERLNLQNAVFSRIEHDDAMVAIVYRVTKPDGSQLILKISPRDVDFRREVYFLKFLAGRLPVPQVVQVVEPEAGVKGAILMECLPGDLLKLTDVNEQMAYEMGRLLAQLHLNRVDGYGDLSRPETLCHDPRIYFGLKFEENFAECKDHLPNQLLERCRHFYETHVALLASVNGPCMVHRDFRPGNVIVHKGKIQGIIDWAGGRGGFAEEDFCSLEHWQWLIYPASKVAFFAGYASVHPIPNYTKIMPLLRIERALGAVGFTVKQGTWETLHTRLYQFNRRFLDEFHFDLA